MPRRLPPHIHWDPDDARRDLVASTPGVDLNLGSVEIRLTAVPLFRAAANGTLEQAIRCSLRSVTPLDTAVTLAVRAGERVLDQSVIESNAETSTSYLFVPEVSNPTRFRITCSSSSHEDVSADLGIEPQRKWSIFLVHHSHFDYGYTDPQAIVMAQQLRYLDATLDLMTATDSWPDDAAFRWNIEVTYPLQRWLTTRPMRMREALIARVKEGRAEINALPFSMHTEVYSIDELAWGLQFADDMRDQYGVEIVSAIQSDVPGATLGLLTLLVDAGIKYLSVAHNYAGRSIPFATGGQDLTRPFSWRAANGKRLVVWQTDTPHGVAYMEGNLVGLAENEAVARELLPDYLLALAEKPYPYGRHAFGWHDLPAGLPVTKQPYPYDLLHLRVQNTIADNAPPSLAVAETVRDWNEAWAFPHLRLATNREFFAAVEAKYGDQLAEFEGDWTDWWVDGVGSGALPLGLNRRAQATIRTARTLHALADTVAGATVPETVREIDQVYEDLGLFDEHTWGAADPWEQGLEERTSGDLQWHRKSAFAYAAIERADTLYDAAGLRFAEAFTSKPDAIASLVVFNPSSKTRTDLVRVLLPEALVPPAQAIAIVDSVDGASIPHSVDLQANPGFRAKGQWLSFLATDVPGIGYRRYQVMPADQSPRGTGGAAPQDPLTLESPNYTVRIDPENGFIASIVDRETGRDLVDSNAPYGFNEYIYDRYASAARFNHLSGRMQAIDMSLFGARTTAGHASVISRRSDSIAERLTLRLVADGTAGLETTITLPHGVKRLDLTNRVQKIATDEKESVYIAFPFAVDDADPEYEITGGVTSPAAPHVPGSAQHMFAIRHWLAMADRRGSVAWATLEAPLIELGTIVLPYAPFPQTIPSDRAKPSTIYSWALNNIWDTNFPPKQGGEMRFRYAVSSDPSQNARALGINTAASLTQPLVGVVATVKAERSSRVLPEAGAFCTVSNPLIEVVTLAAPRRDGDLIAFLHSAAPEAVRVEVAFPVLPVAALAIGTYLERDFQDVPLRDGRGTVTLAPGDYVALRVSLSD